MDKNKPQWPQNKRCTLDLLDNVKSLLPLGQILNNFDPPIKKLQNQAEDVVIYTK